MNDILLSLNGPVISTVNRLSPSSDWYLS